MRGGILLGKAWHVRVYFKHTNPEGRVRVLSLSALSNTPLHPYPLRLGDAEQLCKLHGLDGNVLQEIEVALIVYSHYSDRARTENRTTRLHEICSLTEPA